MPDDDALPTIGQLVSNWLGVQLPAVPMPQTLKNIDKAIGKIILAGGENFEVRIRGNTAKVRANNKINLDGLFRTEEEKRKLENRAAATKAALDDMDADPITADAQAEIDDDWLNLFVRISEDKSSEELQLLFGRILSGEIRRPGSFSLRTVQLMSTISKQDAEALSRLLSYALNGALLPFEGGTDIRLTVGERMFLEELGMAGHASRIGGAQMTYSLQPGQKLPLFARHFGILVENNTKGIVTLNVPGQTLTIPARELLKIANPPSTDIEFLKDVAKSIHTELRNAHATDIEGKFLSVHVVTYTPVGDNQFSYNIIYTQQ